MSADWLKSLKASVDKFWNEEYPRKSFEEKVDYWKKTMEKGMLEQKNLGLPQFGIFSKQWYESVKEQENDIDRIVDTIFNIFWTDIDRKEFDSAICIDIIDED
jgi:hypothetical protein